jgi:2,5-diamino-6-(ribosylamino)-4(3H)-pyrimidinone 5'-phosphate reductase
MRPGVLINCAMSVDGKLALPSRKQTRISSEEDMARVFRLRNECDTILVGVGTILSDDPKLTVKERYVENPKQPLRIVLDSGGRTPPEALVLNEAAPTLIITSDGCDREFRGAETLRCGGERVDIGRLLSILHDRGIESLLVEGGGKVIWSFISAGLFDELTIYVGSMIIGGSGSPTLADGEGALSAGGIVGLKLEGVESLGEGVLLRYLPKGEGD